MSKRDTVAKRVRVAIAQMDPPVQDKEIARRTGVTDKWLTSVKRGHTKYPPVDKLVALADVLGVDPFFLTEPLNVVPITTSTPAKLAEFKAWLHGLPLSKDERSDVLEVVTQRAEEVARSRRGLRDARDVGEREKHKTVSG